MISRAGHSTAALPEGIYRARLPEEVLRRRENAGEPELGCVFRGTPPVRPAGTSTEG